MSDICVTAENGRWKPCWGSKWFLDPAGRGFREDLATSSRQQCGPYGHPLIPSHGARLGKASVIKKHELYQASPFNNNEALQSGLGAVQEYYLSTRDHGPTASGKNFAPSVRCYKTLKNILHGAGDATWDRLGLSSRCVWLSVCQALPHTAGLSPGLAGHCGASNVASIHFKQDDVCMKLFLCLNYLPACYMQSQ